MYNELKKIEQDPGAVTAGALRALLACDDAQAMERLFQAAYRVKERTVGKVVRLRGLIEVSNICRCDCHYCGLRASNKAVERYSMTVPEIADAAVWAWKKGYGSVVLQAGERRDSGFVGLIEEAVREVKARSNGELGVTLSLGEQEAGTYARWFEAGAHRYLLRIETSNEGLFQAIHPPEIVFRARRNCLTLLREAGFQVGTGVMVGLPGQTVEHLAEDILFFRAMDIDMLGLGPYIPHDNTPLAARAGDYTMEQRFNLALRMMALCRLAMPDINMASTTALQALNERGREMGLLAGANVLMPNITPLKYRRDYEIYPGKPCVGDSPEDCARCLVAHIRSIGETVGFREWGDSPHAVVRQAAATPRNPRG